MRYYPEWLPPNWWWEVPEIEQRRRAVEFVTSCQDRTGGFANWSGATPYMECCFHAMTLMNYLNATDGIDESGIVDFIIRRYNQDGGFADEPGEPSTLFNTFYGVVCLAILRKLSLLDRDATVGYLTRLQSDSGGFCHRRGVSPDMIATFWGVVGVALTQGLQSADTASAVDFVTKCKDTHGGYGSAPGEPALMEYTYQALTIKRILGVPMEPFHRVATVSFILGCIRPDGRFGECIGAPPSGGDTMWAVSSLTLLNAIDEIDPRPLDRYLDAFAPPDLWAWHCAGITRIRLLDSEVILRPRVIGIDLLPVRDSVVLTLRSLQSRGITSSTPEVLDVEQETLDDIGEIVNKIDTMMERTVESRKEVAKTDFRPEISRLGKVITDYFFSKQAQSHYAGKVQSFCTLTIPEAMAFIPWELAALDGESLGMRHAVGKTILTELPRHTQVAKGFSQRDAGETELKFLLFGTGTLGAGHGAIPAAEREIADLQLFLQHHTNAEVTCLCGTEATRQNLWSAIEQKGRFDIIHFAGHTYTSTRNAERSGFILADGKLEARILAEKLNDHPPELLLLNSCRSGAGGAISYSFSQESFGILRHFLHLDSLFIGTTWPILDTSGREFANLLYRFLMSGFPIGEAVRRARAAAYTQSGGLGLGWASYSLYGDPMRRLAPFYYIADAIENRHGPQPL